MQRGALQLLDALDACVVGTAQQQQGAAVEAMPAGFLEDFAQRFEAEGLDVVLAPIGARARARMHATCVRTPACAGPACLQAGRVGKLSRKTSSRS